MKLLKTVRDAFDSTIRLLALLAAVLIIFMMLAVSTEVVMRYFLNRPIPWVIEITEYSLLWMTLLATAWLLKEEGHVKMEVVISRFNPRTQALLNIITSILSAIVCLVVVWYGVKVSWDYFQLGYSLETLLMPPAYLVYAIIPVGIFLLFIQFLRRANGYLRSWRALRDKNKRYNTGNYKLKRDR